MKKKLVAIDLSPMEWRAREMGFQHLPVKEIVGLIEEEGVDVIETLVTLPEKQPQDDTPEEKARVKDGYIRKKDALQLSGARVIECPSKRSQSEPSGFKQSDDPRLMLATLQCALKTRPDFVMLFAADGDFAPMVEMLRQEGIRTEVVAPLDRLATDLRRHAVRVINYDEMLGKIKKRKALTENTQ